MIALVFAVLIFLVCLCALVPRRRRYMLWKRACEEGRFEGIEGEPFDGALCLCALTTCIFRDDVLACKVILSVFNEADGGSIRDMCDAAKNAYSLNNDLLTENLAKILFKKKDSQLLKKVLDVLETAEFAWKGENERPSVYLSTLLHYEITSDEKVLAYRILGLEQGASIDKIKGAYRKLSARYHPDKGSENSDMFIKITEAYKLLTK